MPVVPLQQRLEAREVTQGVPEWIKRVGSQTRGEADKSQARDEVWRCDDLLARLRPSQAGERPPRRRDLIAKLGIGIRPEIEE